MSNPIAEPSMLAHVRAEAETFLDRWGHHEFANHGDEYTFGEYVSLAQCADGNIARNNCYISSSEVLELGVEIGGESLVQIAVANEDNYHAALATLTNDGWYAIDFTARQFDQALPFPLVLPQAEWKRLIDDLVDGFTAYCSDTSDPSSYTDETDFEAEDPDFNW